MCLCVHVYFFIFHHTHTHTDSQNCLRTGCNMMMSPLTWLAVRLLREGGEMLGERERGRAKKRDGVRENAGNIYGWRVFVKRSKRHLCVCFLALTLLWCVCELECFGAQPERGGGGQYHTLQEAWGVLSASGSVTVSLPGCVYVNGTFGVWYV